MSHETHFPVDYDEKTLAAMHALSVGAATDGQQILALKWIVEVVCGYYDLSYRPGGAEGDRATSFHEGRRFCGAQIVKATKPATQAGLQEAKAREAMKTRARKPRGEHD